MKFKPFIILLFCISSHLGFGQDFNKKPSNETIKKAKEISVNFFQSLKNGELEKNADFIVNSIGSSWDETKKINEKGDYLKKFQIISLDPEQGGIYGVIDNYDLLDIGFLKGSDRYIRLVYIGYHPGAVLMYEFRYYLNPKKELKLQYIGWSESNPFEYMSTSDIIMTKY